MIDIRSVAAIRAAEEVAFRQVPTGALMQRASHALAVSCARLLGDVRGAVVGSRVVILAGSGNNGGDALWAGATLARRGCRVDAVTLSKRFHHEGAEALVAAGGRLVSASDEDAVDGVVLAADLVLDGILGIGGSGGLRPEADRVVQVASRSGALIVAVDVPSGVNADTGAVQGPAVDADVTVTFGAAKAGLLVAPGRIHAGTVQIVDIGLDFGDDAPVARIIEPVDVDRWVPEPAEDAYKYSRGVAGLAVGSSEYRGAALLAAAAARHSDVGMVRLLDRRDGVAELVVSHYPDVVVDGTSPAEQVRATAWGCGSGFPGAESDEPTVLATLAAAVPVVLDAGALSVVAASADVRERLRDRFRVGLITVLTPHDGEFERMLPELLARVGDRRQAAVDAARELQCIVLLKGAGTVVAGPAGEVWIDIEGTADLGVAGSGDVLTGILTGVLAGAHARGDLDHPEEAVAAAVWLHGCAGRLAAAHAPVTAPDIAMRVGAAVHAARFGIAPNHGGSS